MSAPLWDYYSVNDRSGSRQAFLAFKEQYKQLQDWRSSTYRTSLSKTITLNPLQAPIPLQEWTIYQQLTEAAIQTWDVPSTVEGKIFPPPAIIARPQPVFGVPENAKLLIEKQPITVLKSITQSADLYCAIHAFNNLMGARLLSPDTYSRLLAITEASEMMPERGALTTCETEALLLLSRLLGVFLVNVVVLRYEPFGDSFDLRDVLDYTTVRRFLASSGGFIMLLDSEAGKHYVAVLYGGLLKTASWGLAGKWVVLDSIGPRVSGPFNKISEAVNSFVEESIQLFTTVAVRLNIFVPATPLLEEDGDIQFRERELSASHAALLKAGSYIGMLDLTLDRFYSIIRSTDAVDATLFGSGLSMEAMNVVTAAQNLLFTSDVNSWRSSAVLFVLSMLGASTIMQRMTAAWFALVAYTVRSLVAGAGEGFLNRMFELLSNVYICMRNNNYPEGCNTSVLELLEIMSEVSGRRAVPLFYTHFLSSEQAVRLLRKFSLAFLSALSAVVRSIYYQLESNRGMSILLQHPEPIDPISPQLLNEWISRLKDVDGSVENVLLRSGLYEEFMQWFVDQWFEAEVVADSVDESKFILKNMLQMAASQISTLLAQNIVVRPSNWSKRCVQAPPVALDFVNAYSQRESINSVTAKQFYV